jgi:hypothetical protein
MSTVEICRRRPEDGEIERLARVHAEEGEAAQLDVLIPEFAEGIQMLMANGVVDGEGRTLTLEDGQAYVAALPDFYRSSRFWAEVVQDDDED